MGFASLLIDEPISLQMIQLADSLEHQFQATSCASGRRLFQSSQAGRVVSGSLDVMHTF